MSSKYDILADPPKALCFDVFGTVVNWQKTVTATLLLEAAKKQSSATSEELKEQLSKIKHQQWAQSAAEWRKAYIKFVIGHDPDKDEWEDIDTHHHKSLIALLKKLGLENLYTPEEVENLSKVWHFLEPHPDSSEGIKRLGAKFVTSTLSNGTHKLLEDLNAHGNLGFQVIQSAEDWKAYKPKPIVYQGGCKKLGLEPNQVALVAAHIGDLAAARSNGMRTIYVEREGEEAVLPGSKEYEEAKEWMDLWVTVKENGIIAVAEKFGL
jgi:2-haloacid dehalogenase